MTGDMQTHAMPSGDTRTGGARTAGPPASDTAFETRTAAPTWEDGLLTGSGRVGALVYGPPDRLTVTLAHERFFIPANPRPAAPDLRPALPAIRAALLAGDPDAAAGFSRALGDAGFEHLVWTDPLGMCAALALRPGIPLDQTRRSMDPAAGVVGVDARTAEGAGVHVRVVAPRGYDTVWVSLSAEVELTWDLTLSLEVDGTPAASFAPDYTGAVSARPRAGDPGRLDVVGPDDTVIATTRASGGWHREGEHDAAIRSTVRVTPDAPALLRLDVTVAGHAARPAPDAAWADVRASQTLPHRELVAASGLALEAPSAPEPVEDLWNRARTGDARALRRATDIAYLSGRAHTIAATGELPATLQGVWQGTFTPAWSADYTLNGNVQNGTLAPLIPTGTPDLARGILNLVLPHLADFRANAARVFDADGMLLPSRMSTHGAANHANGDFPHVFWTGCGGWILRIAADLVATTGDRSLVDDRLWALAEGVLRFAETALIRDGDHARLVPNYSPENTPGGAGAPLAADSTMDVAVLRDAARATALLGRARGDDALDDRWARVVELLPEYRVAGDGTLAEWIAPGYDEQLAHRHVSQLYPLWYDPDAAFLGDSASARALRDAAGETIRRKLAWRAEDPGPPPGRGEMAFGLAQLGLAAAALGDAASAHSCVRTLVLDHWQPALTTTHDNGRIFNLDASGALPAVVAAMLLGSSIGELRLLPALLDEWPRGEVTGLRARGGIIVDRLTWDDVGAEVELRMLPEARWLNPTGEVTLRPGSGFAVDGPSRVTVDDTRTVRLRRR
ncbi:glycoside hydrolase family 95-like protein [Microbacterium sp. Marseille-Q6648]|uniref:glycosyl hydrolase family 95 catalytic domain-containing protein n=1 Tax=Microbacterium sp. Marseille-Q6648 TaxID=2937991 RepID=UPI00203B3F58|nr:glycoside hydrolase N-terminal domain-containing protein [Microbacterium sp. Marseille-Q6648]